MAKQLVIDKHVIDAPLVDIILAIKAELTNGKLRSYKVTGDSVMVPCPFHKKGLEKHFSCGLYCGTDPTLEYGHFNCLACGESGSLAYFVGECFDEDEDFGKKWLVSHFGNDIVENTFFALFKWKEDKKIEYMDE